MGSGSSTSRGKRKDESDHNDSSDNDATSLASGTDLSHNDERQHDDHGPVGAALVSRSPLSLNAPTTGDSIATVPTTHRLGIHHCFGVDVSACAHAVKVTAVGHLVYPCGMLCIVADPTTAAQLIFQEHKGTISSLALHRDRRMVATGEVASRADIIVWDSRTGDIYAQMTHAHTQGVACLEFASAESGLLASIGLDQFHSVTLWKWREEERVATAKGHTEPILDLRFNPVDTDMISVGVHHAQLWSITPSSERKVLHRVTMSQSSTVARTHGPDNHTVYSAVFTGVDTWVSGSDHGHIGIYRGPQLVSSIQAHLGALLDMVYTREGLATCGQDGILKHWTLDPMLKALPVLADELSISAEMGSNDTIMFGHADGGASIDGHVGPRTLLRCLDTVPGGMSIVIGTGTNEVIEIIPSEETMVCVAQGHVGGVTGIASHPYKDEVFTCGVDGTVRLWSVGMAPCMIALHDCGVPAVTLEVSPQGTTLAVGLSSGFMIFVPETLLTLETDLEVTVEVTSMAFSPDAQLLAVGTVDGWIAIYSVTLTGVVRAAVLSLQFGAPPGCVSHIDWDTECRFIRSEHPYVAQGETGLLYWDAHSFTEATMMDVYVGVKAWSRASTAFGTEVKGLMPSKSTCVLVDNVRGGSLSGTPDGGLFALGCGESSHPQHPGPTTSVCVAGRVGGSTECMLSASSFGCGVHLWKATPRESNVNTVSSGPAVGGTFDAPGTAKSWRTGGRHVGDEDDIGTDAVRYSDLCRDDDDFGHGDSTGFGVGVGLPGSPDVNAATPSFGRKELFVDSRSPGSHQLHHHHHHHGEVEAETLQAAIESRSARARHLIDREAKRTQRIHANTSGQHALQGSPSTVETPRRVHEQWRRVIRGPSSEVAQPPSRRQQQLEDRLIPYRVTGYNGEHSYDNLFILKSGELVYATAAVGVVMSPVSLEQRLYCGHTLGIVCMAVDEERGVVASAQGGGSAPAKVHIWLSKTAAQTTVLQGDMIDAGVSAMGFSSDGKMLATVSSGPAYSVTVWDWHESRPLVTRDASVNPLYCIRWSPGAEEFVTCGVDGAHLWEVYRPKGGVKLQRRELKGSIDDLVSAAYVDNKTIVAAGSDGSVHMWRNGEHRQQAAGHAGAIHTVDSWDGHIVSGGADGTVRLWTRSLDSVTSVDLRGMDLSGGETESRAGQSRTVRAVRIRNGRIVCGTSLNEIVDVGGDDLFILTNGHFGGSVRGIAVHPKGKGFATCGDDRTVRRIAADHSLEAVSEAWAPALCLAFAPNGGRLGVGLASGEIVIVDSETLQTANDLVIPTNHATTCVAFSGDGTMLAAGTEKGVIIVVTLSRVESSRGATTDSKGFNHAAVLVRLAQHSGAVKHLDWSRDMQHLRSNCSESELLFWDVRCGLQVTATAARDVEWATSNCPLTWATRDLQGSKGLLTADRSRDNSAFVVGGGGQLAVTPWPVTVQPRVHKRAGGHETTAVARFAPNGETVVTTGVQDATVIVWWRVSQLKPSQPLPVVSPNFCRMRSAAKPPPGVAASPKVKAKVIREDMAIESAALKIQALARGKQDRVRVVTHKKEALHAVVKIQARSRGILARAQVRRRKEVLEGDREMQRELEQQMQRSAVLIQSVARGKLERKRVAHLRGLQDRDSVEASLQQPEDIVNTTDSVRTTASTNTEAGIANADERTTVNAVVRIQSLARGKMGREIAKAQHKRQQAQAIANETSHLRVFGSPAPAAEPPQVVAVPQSHVSRSPSPSPYGHAGTTDESLRWELGKSSAPGQWRSQLRRPSSGATPSKLPLPDLQVKPSRVLGFRGHDSVDTARLVDKSTLVYPAAAFVVILDLTTSVQRLYSRHVADVQCVAVHAGRRRAASAEGGVDGRIDAWSLTTLECHAQIVPESQGPWTAVEFNAEGDLLATAQMDLKHTVTVWDWQQCTAIATASAGASPAAGLTWAPPMQGLSPDGYHCTNTANSGMGDNTFATCGRNGVALWSLEFTPGRGSSLKRRSFHPGLSPRDSTGAAAGDDMGVTTIVAVAFLEHDTIVGGGADGFIYEWQLEASPTTSGAAGQRKHCIKAHTGAVFALCVGSGGRLFSGGADGHVKKWNPRLTSWQGVDLTFMDLRGATEGSSKRSVHALTACEGRVVAGTSLNELLDVGGVEVGVLVSGHYGRYIASIDAHPRDEGAFVTAGDDCTVRRWSSAHATTATEIAVLDAPCVSVCFSPDGSRIVVGLRDGSVCILRGGSLNLLAKSQVCGVGVAACCVRFSPSRDFVAVGDAEGLITIIDIDARLSRVAVLKSHSGAVTAIDWSVDGECMRSNCTMGELLFWQRAAGVQLSKSPVPFPGKHHNGIPQMHCNPTVPTSGWTSIGSHALRDTQWTSGSTCHLSYEAGGLHTHAVKVRKAALSHGRRWLALGVLPTDAHPCLSLRFSSAPAPNGGESVVCHGHRQVTGVAFGANDTCVLTSGGSDLTVIEWGLAGAAVAPRKGAVRGVARHEAATAPAPAPSSPTAVPSTLGSLHEFAKLNIQQQLSSNRSNISNVETVNSTGSSNGGMSNRPPVVDTVQPATVVTVVHGLATPSDLKPKGGDVTRDTDADTTTAVAASFTVPPIEPPKTQVHSDVTAASAIVSHRSANRSEDGDVGMFDMYSERSLRQNLFTDEGDGVVGRKAEQVDDSIVPSPPIVPAAELHEAVLVDGPLPRSDHGISLSLRWRLGHSGATSLGAVVYTAAGSIVYPCGRVCVSVDPCQDSSTPVPTQSVFEGHGDDVLCLALHPGGRLVASGEVGTAPAICVWDGDTAAHVTAIRGFHKRGVVSVSFMAEGTRLVSLGLDEFHSIAVWHWATGELVASAFGSENKLFAVRTNPYAGDCFVSVGADHMKLWTIHTDKLHGRRAVVSADSNDGNGMPPTLLCAEFLDEGTVVTGSADGKIHVWIDSVLEGHVAAHGGPVYTLAATRRGVASGGADGMLSIWTKALQRIAALDTTVNGTGSVGSFGVRAVAWAPSLDTVVFGRRDGVVGTIVLRDAGPPTLLTATMKPGDGAAAIAMHPSAGIVAILTTAGAVCVWSLAARRMVQVGHVPHGEGTALCYSHDGRRLIIGMGSGEVVALNASTLQPADDAMGGFMLVTPPRSATPTPTSPPMLLSSSGGGPPSATRTSDSVCALAVSECGAMLAVARAGAKRDYVFDGMSHIHVPGSGASGGGHIDVYDLSSSKGANARPRVAPVCRGDSAGPITAIDWSVDGAHLRYRCSSGVTTVLPVPPPTHPQSDSAAVHSAPARAHSRGQSQAAIAWTGWSCRGAGAIVAACRSSTGSVAVVAEACEAGTVLYGTCEPAARTRPNASAEKSTVKAGSHPSVANGSGGDQDSGSVRLWGSEHISEPQRLLLAPEDEWLVAVRGSDGVLMQCRISAPGVGGVGHTTGQR